MDIRGVATPSGELASAKARLLHRVAAAPCRILRHGLAGGSLGGTLTRMMRAFGLSAVWNPRARAPRASHQGASPDHGSGEHGDGAPRHRRCRRIVLGTRKPLAYASGTMTEQRPKPPLLVTHSGTFHLDDAFAYAALRLALGLGVAGEGHVLVRTRDEAVIARADMAWDVGAIYDPVRMRFDHHQRGAPTREDGLPFSAAGLVWRHHGEAAVRAVLEPSGAGDLAAPVAAAIDREVVRRIDEIDNGIGEPGGPLDLSALVEDLNPAWDSAAARDQAAEDAAFRRAADLVEGFLQRRAEAVRARLAAEAEVLAAHGRAADPRILELGRKMPWHDSVHAHGLPALYAVYPVPNGNWMVDTVPAEPGGFAPRLPLPEAWAGLRDRMLAEVSGVPDAVFVHLRRFVGAARSREGALEMARRAIAEERAALDGA